MSEDKKNDTVSIDEHNRIVATANARQAELEDMRRQVSDLKSKVSDVESIQKLKEEWNKETALPYKELPFCSLSQRALTREPAFYPRPPPSILLPRVLHKVFA